MRWFAEWMIERDCAQIIAVYDEWDREADTHRAFGLLRHDMPLGQSSSYGERHVASDLLAIYCEEVSVETAQLLHPQLFGEMERRGLLHP